MIRVLIIQERGRHKLNEYFREALSFKRAFYKLGIESTVWGLNYDNFNCDFDKLVNEHNVILLLENYDETNWIPNLSQYSNHLKIFFSIDSHMVLSKHINTVKSNNINIVLNAIDTHQIHFKPYSTTYYFPNSYDSDLIYPKPNINKIHDIGFCGSILDREQILNKIPNIKKDIFVIGEEMVNAINSYKIHFNRTLSNDINYRVFETFGCNTMLLTNNTENLDNLFKINTHLVSYSCDDDLLDKVWYYGKHDLLRNKISNAGYEYVKTHYTYYHRTKQLISIIKENL